MPVYVCHNPEQNKTMRVFGSEPESAAIRFMCYTTMGVSKWYGQSAECECVEGNVYSVWLLPTTFAPEGRYLGKCHVEEEATAKPSQNGV